MITLIYSNKEQGMVYILTRQMHTVLHPYENLSLVSPGRIILLCQIALTNLSPSLSNDSML